MIGQKFTRLTVVEFSHLDARHRKHYLCRCDCGTEKTIQAGLLRSGNTKSCGCLGTEVRRTRTKLPNNGGVVNFLILQYKRHARDRGIEYHLDREEFDRLIRLPCHYCADPGSNVTRTKNCPEGFRHNGIDRLDSQQAYITGNCVPCCAFCNRAKGNRPARAFVEWAQRVARHNQVLERAA